jgi:hypothetical protein
LSAADNAALEVVASAAVLARADAVAAATGSPAAFGSATATVPGGNTRGAKALSLGNASLAGEAAFEGKASAVTVVVGLAAS